jgi:hypothetical protein
MLLILSDDVFRRILIDVKFSRYLHIKWWTKFVITVYTSSMYCVSVTLNEMFTGFHELERQDAETLFTITIIPTLDINIINCRGQFFDGAANVAGSINGLQSKKRDM